MHTGATFFAAAETERALSELAEAEKLTLVVGAGVAIESRLPSWTQLVVGLLQRGAKSVLPAKSSAAQQQAFAEWAVRSDGLLAGASLARAAGQTDRDIAAVLYAASGDSPVPGPSARAIARLARDTGCAVITTNYDETIEHAIEELGAKGSAQSAVAVTGPAVPETGVPVVHLHGLFRKSRPVGKVVLDEEDFYALGSDAWQEEAVRRALEEGSCLFVGASMTDPNLLRYLHRASRRHRHYAVLVRQADTYAVQNPPDSAVEQARFVAASRRWAGLGITALQPEFFYDSAQLLYELLARRDGSLGGGFRSRLDTWIQDVEDVYLSSDPVQFAEAQDFLHAELARLKDRICEIVHHATDPKDERFGVGLWALRPGEPLLLIGNSDRAHRDRDTLDPVPLVDPSDWTAVETFRSGTPQARDVQSRFGTRWNTVIGFPVSIESAAYGRLQVGVVTVAGTEPYDSSALSPERLGPHAFTDVARLAHDYATGLLLPDPGGD